MSEVLKDSIGVVGIPVTNAMHNDNMITIVLLLCFVLVFVAIAQSRSFFSRQVKGFFLSSHGMREESVTETSSEVRWQIILVGVFCLLMGVSSYILAVELVGTPFRADSNILMACILSGAVLCYLILKWILQTIVNCVFFGSKKNKQWIKVQLLLIALFAILIYPMVLLQVYFDLSIKNAILYFGIILLFGQILTFYQSWVIFFRQNGFFLQTFLYFCALEITPLLAFGGAWWMMINGLKVNY